MTGKTNVLIVTAHPGISALVELARTLGGTVRALTVGDVPVAGVDEVLSIPLPPDVPAEAAAPAVATAVAELLAGGNAAAPGQGQDLVLAPNTRVERAFAGAIAARLNAPILTNVQEVAGDLTLTRFGGIAVERVTAEGAVVVVKDGGEDVPGEPVPAKPISTAAMSPVRVTGEVAEQGGSVNLAAAKRIVALGRGFRSEADLTLGRELAAALGAEVACSRPLSEGSGWMAKETYIGVSGLHVKPELYVAVGISGQLHHTAGVRDAGVVIVINDDEDAPYFRAADYGVVGDLYQVLPALTAELG